MKYFLTFFIGLSLLFTSCTNTSEDQTDENTPAQESSAVSSDGWVLHETGLYSVSAPSDWEYDVSGRSNTRFVLFAPFDSLSKGFRENVNLITEDLSGTGMDLQSYVDQSEGMLKEFMKELTNFQVQENEGRYWFTYQARQGVMRLDMIQMFAIENNVVHIVTYTQREDSETSHKPVAISILNGYQAK